MTRVAAAALLLAAALPAAAQGPQPRTLTWEDCVRLAQSRNPALAAARDAESAGRADYKGSFNGLLPTLDLSNSYNTSNTAAPGSNRYSAEAAASVRLLSASAIAGVRSASASLAGARAGLRQASASVRYTLRQAFAQLIYAQENDDVAERIREMRDKDAQLVALRYKSGRESKGNMMRASAQLLQANADLAQARRALRTAQRALDRELGLDDFAVVAVTGTLAASAPPPTPEQEAALLSARPDVAVQEAAVRGAEASLSSARASLWPSLTGSYTRFRDDRVEFPHRLYGWTAGATLSLPLFGGGPTATYYAVSAAKSSLDKARQDLRAVRDAAIVDLDAAWASYAAAVDQVGVQRALLEAARQRNDEADVRYASGLLTYDNWEIIASDRISTEKQAISSEVNAAVAQAAWERSIGKELGE